MKDCYNKFMALEEFLIMTNIIINSFLFCLSVLLLNGVKNNKPSHMIPFMFVQGLTISGLIAAAVTALVIYFQEGSWKEDILVVTVCSLFIFLHIYFALVIRACYNELRKTKKMEVPICKQEEGLPDKYKEMTLEDYVF